MARNRLDNSYGQSVFGVIEVEDVFAGCLALVLLPMKELFDFGMFDDCDALVVVEEPLDYVWDRIIIRRPGLVAKQNRAARGFSCTVGVQWWRIFSVNVARTS